MIPSRRARRGMSLLEVMITLAILVALVGVVTFSYREITGLEQRRVAKNLATTWELLHDEAVLRNVTFRIGFDLHENTYQIEVGDPKVLIFSNPDDREAYERQRELDLRRTSRRERAEGRGPQDEGKFQKLAARFQTEVTLPRGSRFGGVYTPQYGRMMTVDDLGKRDEDNPQLVYAYIFANGFAEHAVVQIVEEKDPRSGFTIEVEPLSGRVALRPELTSFEKAFAWVPSRGPDLPN